MPARSPELLYASVAIYGSSVFDFVSLPFCSSPHLPLLVFPSARVNEEQYLARHFTVTKKHRGLHGMDKSSAPRVSFSYAAQNAYRRKTSTPAAEGTTDLTGDPRDKRTRRSGHDCNYETLIVGPSVHEYIQHCSSSYARILHLSQWLHFPRRGLLVAVPIPFLTSFRHLNRSFLHRYSAIMVAPQLHSPIHQEVYTETRIPLGP